MVIKASIIISILFAYSSCKQADCNSNQRVLDLAISKRILCVDMTINNVLKLNNAQSITDALGDLSNRLNKPIQESPYLLFINEGDNQYLKLIKWEGSGPNYFSYFEVGKLVDKETSSVHYHSYFNDFKTECGIHLGLGKDSLILIKGLNFTISNENLVEVMKYTGENLYCAKYYLQAGKIIKYEFGFEYP